MKIKLCGLTREQDIEAANRCAPDFVGFVFAESRRRISMETASRFRRMLAPEIRTVGVFVNAPIEQIETLCKEKTITLIQLHGDEDAAYCAEIRRRTGVPVIRAVRVRSAEQIRQAEGEACDCLLLDAAAEGAYGGSGTRFDLSLIPPLQKPFFLAGGLDENNLIQAAAQCRPWAVDVSSGAETCGLKDAEKMARLTALVRQWNSAQKLADTREI